MVVVSGWQFEPTDQTRPATTSIDLTSVRPSIEIQLSFSLGCPSGHSRSRSAVGCDGADN